MWTSTQGRLAYAALACIVMVIAAQGMWSSYIKMAVAPEWTRRMRYQGRHWKR